MFYGSLLAKEGLCIGLPERKSRVRVNGFVQKGRYRYQRPFTGYMFLGVNPGVNALYALFKLRILWSIVGDHRGIHIFDSAAISTLYSRLDCGKFDGLVDEPVFEVDIKSGDSARITDGAYRGQIVKVNDFEGKIAKVTGEIFGGKHRMQVPISTLERI